MTEAKKYYHSEEIEFQNGATVVAKPLPIKKLKVLQKVFEDYGYDLRKLANIQQDLMNETKKLQEKGEDPDPLFESTREKLDKMELMSWEDAIVAGALVALNCWHVKDVKGKTVDISEEYVEENLDAATAERICEVAGNFQIGQLSESQSAEGKATTEG